jgi:eukaryotic-like serine/threonine-protein kinase
MNVPDQQSVQASGQMSGPLTEILTHGPVPIDTLVRWGAQLARELAGAHEVGRVHGNVRAAVVSVGVDGAARLSGFNEPASGSAAHPAPELANGGVPTRASDVFALGAVLYGAGGGGDPRLMPLWTAMGHADPAQRPTASQVAERLDRLDEKKPKHRRKALIITGIAVVVVLAVLAGLAVVTGTWSTTTRQPAAAPADWKDPVGDLRTADPCALVDANAMQRFGATRLYPDLNTFNSCTMEMRPSANERVSLLTSLVNPLADDNDLAGVRTQRIGALSLYLGNLHNEEDNQTACQRILVFPNRARVGLKVWSASTEKKTDLCAVADAAVQVVLRALDTPSLPRRNLTTPPNSLAGIDACTLVDEATLRTIPGLEPDKRIRTEGTWSCEWGDDPQVADPPVVSIVMDRGVLPTGDAATIAGRAATVDSTYSDSEGITCRIALTQRSYQSIYDEPRIEVLLVSVRLNVAALPDAQCAVARTIAEAAAAKLPPPS